MSIKVTSTIKLNLPAIEKLNKNAVKALEITADQLKTDISNKQVIPFKDGQLKDSLYVDNSQLHKGIVNIVTSTPYARRLYYNPESQNVEPYTRKNGRAVKGYLTKSFQFHKSVWTDKKGTHGAHVNAKDHWYEDWLKGGTRENFCKNAFKQIFKGLNNL